MRNVRAVLRFVISLLLMFTLLFLQLSIFEGRVFLNEKYYNNKLENSNYYRLVNKELQFAFKNYSLVTSIPDTVFSKAISEELLKDIGRKNIHNAVGYMKYTQDIKSTNIDGAEFKKSINDYISNYAKENNISIDDQLKSQINDIVDETVKITSNHTELFNIKAVYKFSEFQKFRKLSYLISKSLIFALIAVMLFIVLLVILNKYRPRRTFLWVGSSFIPAGIMMAIPATLALIYKIPERFVVETSYIKEALKVITTGYINFFLLSGIIYILSGIVMIAVYARLRKVARSKRI